MAKAKKSKRIHQMTILQWEVAFPHEEACAAYLIRHRWPEGVYCPRCDVAANNPVKTMPNKWQCYGCSKSGYRFSHITGTVFENTNKPLRQWFRVVHLMLTSKKGMSALQIHRVMGFGSYETAWSMCHRIRAALADEKFTKLMGIVEVDETSVGGKAKNRHWNKRGGGGGGGTGGIGSGKFAVVGAVSRKGNVVARVIDNVRGGALTEFVRETVSTKVSLLCTDTWGVYNKLNQDYPHKSVDHAANQYVVGAVHTQTIEGFWSLVKRGMVGTFHKVSKKYLPLYVAEIQFHYNNRENDNIFAEAIQGC